MSEDWLEISSTAEGVELVKRPPRREDGWQPPGGEVLFALTPDEARGYANDLLRAATYVEETLQHKIERRDALMAEAAVLDLEIAETGLEVAE